MSSTGHPSSADTAFDANQFALPYSPGVENHFWNVARNRIVLRHLRRVMARQIVPRALVLDVGCGPGIMVGHLRDAGIDCRGVELGRPEVRPGLESVIAIGTDARMLSAETRERAGTILLLDVVEHIERPAEFNRILDQFLAQKKR